MKSFKRITAGLIILTATLIWSIGFGNKAISMQAKRTDKGLDVSFQISKSYGIQKKGPHEITVYEIPANHPKENKIEKIISTYGKKTYEMKQVKFSGITAKDDKDYFSSVNSINIPVSNKNDLGIKAQIYFCSFADSFCSVEVINVVLPK